MVRLFMFLIAGYCLIGCSSARRKSKKQHETCTPTKTAPAQLIQPSESKPLVVSIGWKCTSRWVIQHIYHDGGGVQTHFFDWVFSHPPAVLATFSAPDAQAVFTPERTQVRDSNVFFDDIPSFTSVHDYDADKDPKQEKLKVIDTYKRRFERLIQLAKEAKQVYWLRWQQDSPPWEEKLIEDFFKKLEDLQANNQHYLVSVGLTGDAAEQKTIEKKYRYKFFNLTDYPKVKEEPTSNWSFDDYDWNRVFKWVRTTASKKQN